MINKSRRKVKLLLNIPRPNKAEVYRAIKDDLKSSGRFLYSDNNEPIYYTSNKNNCLNILDKEFALWLSTKYNIDRAGSMFKGIIKYLEGYAYKYGTKIEIHKFCYFDKKRFILYVNRFDGRMYRLDGKNVKHVPLGTDGIFFDDPDYYVPFKRKKSPGGLADAYLFKKDNFSSDEDLPLQSEEQQFILRWIFYSYFFESLLPTKPILVIYGPPNSRKTDTLRSILKFLFGPDADVTAPSDPRNLKVLANHEHILFLDDFDQTNRNLEPHLVRISTGIRGDEREYYSNKNISRIKPNAFIGITTKLPYFSREDFIQRMIVLRFDNHQTNISSRVITDEILEKRNEIWWDVLKKLNRIVHWLKVNENRQPFKVEFRHAAWAEFVLRANSKYLHKRIFNLLEKINKDQIVFLIEANP
jgi:hypothetical protein